MRQYIVLHAVQRRHNGVHVSEGVGAQCGLFMQHVTHGSDLQNAVVYVSCDFVQA